MEIAYLRRVWYRRGARLFMQCFLDNRFHGHRPAGLPDKRHPVRRERRPRRRDDNVVGIALGWREWRADRVAQRGSGGPEANGSFVLPFRGGDFGQVFERDSDAFAVTDLMPEFQAFSAG